MQLGVEPGDGRPRPDYRVLVRTGMLDAGFAVTGQLASDGAVELASIEIDPA